MTSGNAVKLPMLLYKNDGTFEYTSTENPFLIKMEKYKDRLDRNLLYVLL